jgi:predicted transcriptional regulator
MKHGPLPDPVKLLEEEIGDGGKSVQPLEIDIVKLMKTSAVKNGELEFSTNELIQKIRDDLHPDYSNYSRNEILVTLERLVVRNILRRRSAGRRHSFSLRVFVQAARESWSEDLPDHDSARDEV